jgi:uncharacterized membrane-anchored protein
MNQRRILVKLILAGQLLVMIGLIARQEYKWRAWRTIQLKVVPVDPVALFRGRYVDLAYDFSSLQAPYGEWKKGDTIYLRLKAGSDGTWQLAGFSHDPERPAEEILLRGQVEAAHGNRITVQTGIESYFMAERKAPKIERLSPKEYDIRVEVAVSEDGRAALKQLYVQGRPAEEFEPR